MSILPWIISTVAVVSAVVAWLAARRHLRDERRSTTILRAAADELLATRDPSETFEIVRRAVERLVGGERCTLVSLRAGEVRSARPGQSPSSLPIVGPPRFEPLSPTARIYGGRVPVPANPVNGLMTPERATQSMIVCPLAVAGRAHGFIAVESAQAARFSDSDLASLSHFARAVAATLENIHQHRRATIDSLTGSMLREPFRERLAEELERARRYGGGFAVLMLDLDRFKEINDVHGHLAGDRLLAAASRTIRRHLRRADVCGRWGGDEFCVLLPATDMDGATQMAERIRRAVEDLVVDSHDALLTTTVSVGVSAYPRHAATAPDELLLQADAALYAAKRHGRNRVA